jgi:hypothetical protein
VGAVNIPISGGPTVLSNPFLKPIDFQGAVSSVAGSVITMESTVPTPSVPSFVQVLSGADTGKIYDIDSISGVDITLVASSTALVTSDTIAIRPHMTASDLGTLLSGTTLTLLEPGGTPLVGVYLPTGWAGGFGSTVIYPGEGFVINNASPQTITVYGSVSEDDVIFEAAAGPAIIGSIDPVNGSTDVLATVAAGALTNSTLTELDAGGTPLTYIKLPTIWVPSDPSTSVDVTDYKSFVLNSSGVDIVNSGNVIAP